jgi:hypothetical protein
MVASNIMTRTTVNIASPILKDLKRLQRQQGRSLGEIISDLLARALADEARAAGPRAFSWAARPMRARVDLEDRDAVQAILDRHGGEDAR